MRGLSTLLDWLRRERVNRRQGSRAAAIAEHAFRARYPSEKLIPGMTHVFHHDEGGVIMQLCHEWGGIPPRRTWWRVAADDSCRELSYEETNAIRAVSAWR